MKSSINLTVLCALVLITLIMVVIYAAVQQTYRSGANDPQIQIARDMATKLEIGRPAIANFQNDTIDIANSLAPFYVFYNANKQPVQASGYLNGKLPQLPNGVLDYANTNGEDWITWQPQKNVRMAMIVKKVVAPSIAYVAVGRSLQEVEIREANLRKMVFIDWIISIVILGISWVVNHKSISS